MLYSGIPKWRDITGPTGSPPLTYKPINRDGWNQLREAGYRNSIWDRWKTRNRGQIRKVEMNQIDNHGNFRERQDVWGTVYPVLASDNSAGENDQPCLCLETGQKPKTCRDGGSLWYSYISRSQQRFEGIQPVRGKPWLLIGGKVYRGVRPQVSKVRREGRGGPMARPSTG